MKSYSEEDLKRVAEAVQERMIAAWKLVPEDAGSLADLRALQEVDLDAIIQSVAVGGVEVPDGWKLVPKFPTKEMIDASVFHCQRENDDEPYRARGQASAVYLDMLAAAPQAPQSAAQAEEPICPACKGSGEDTSYGNADDFRATAPICLTCNGIGMLVGNAQDGSFDGERCPECSTPSQPVGAVDELPELPEPDGFAILTPNGSRLVSPEEARGCLQAYSFYSAGQVRERDAVWQALLRAALAAHQPAGVNELANDDIERLADALSWMGYATPESKEERAARWPMLVRDLIGGVLASKMIRQSSDDGRDAKDAARFVALIEEAIASWDDPNDGQIFKAISRVERSRGIGVVPTIDDYRQAIDAAAIRARGEKGGA